MRPLGHRVTDLVILAAVVGYYAILISAMVATMIVKHA
jgi:hypothetical protein